MANLYGSLSPLTTGKLTDGIMHLGPCLCSDGVYV